MINLKDKTIIHSSLGMGTVTDFYPRTQRFVIKFKDGAEKLYQYPDDFKYGILKLDDSEINAELEKDLMVVNNKASTFTKGGKKFYGQKDPKGLAGAPYKDPLEVDKLEHGIAYGTSAEKIYNALCQNKSFNWNKSKSYMFGPKMQLAATDCTNNRETVWFLAYSSYNDKRNDDIGTNNIVIGTNDIEQVHDTEEYKNRLSAGYVGETQIVFVKNFAGQYEFWGKMKVTAVNNEIEPFSTYSKFLSDTYRP